MEHKIAWFTEGGWHGKVPRNHPNMRNDVAWMHVLDADHYPIMDINKIQGDYDLGIITIPKTNIDKLMQFPILENMKNSCKKIGFMQEGPYWYFQDYPMEQQIWFYNALMEMDVILAHNNADVEYFKGLTQKNNVYLNRTLMITDYIQPDVTNLSERSGVIIGGNMVRWYGGFDSYIIAQEFDEEIFAPSMGRMIERENEMDITHLPFMNLSSWMNNLSRYKYAVHLMPTHAAGTFALNCAYHGIPCIGYEGLDTQQLCHPQLTIKMNDLKHARELANRLKTDDNFYETQSEVARNNFDAFFGEKEYTNKINKVISEVMNETN